MRFEFILGFRVFANQPTGHSGGSLQGICTQESRQHPVLLDTKPDKMTVAILN